MDEADVLDSITAEWLRPVVWHERMQLISANIRRCSMRLRCSFTLRGERGPHTMAPCNTERNMSAPSDRHHVWLPLLVVGSKAVHGDWLEGRLRASSVKVGNSVGYHYDILPQGLPPVRFLKPVGICIPPNPGGLSPPARPPPQRTIVVDRNKERIGSSFSLHPAQQLNLLHKTPLQRRRRTAPPLCAS